ncbi:MAG TPA: hypothetical protein VG099_20525 [Gemmataceae bacterium]|nr:hypothetical protein [Gemmataceae bacterium]
MGGFYGSVHVRSNDQTAVKAALQAIAVKQKARFLLGPEVNGWVSIYPNHSGQDERLAKVIARRIQGECIYVVVHDDDIFAYDYFQDGKRIDSYNSRPDYFQEVSAREKARLRGRPKLLEHLLAPGRSLEELASLLSENPVEESPFASNQLEGFAGLLGLPNAITAYEYLMDGETDGVERWDKFIHVPDLSAENAQKEAANTETLQERERLRQAGLLVYESRGQGSALRHVVWCRDGAGSGFLVSWQDYGDLNPEPRALERVGPPWSGATPTPIPVEPFVYQLCTSPTGRFLAASHASGNWKSAVWDLGSQERLWETENSPHTAPRLLFSADERHLVRHDQETVAVFKVETGRRLAECKSWQATSVAMHASGTVVSGDARGKLIFLDPLSGRRLKTLCLGEKVDERPLHMAAAARMQANISEMDTEAGRAQLQKQFTGVAKLIAKQLSGSPWDPKNLLEAGYVLNPDGTLEVPKTVEVQIAKLRQGLETQQRRLLEAQIATGVESDAIRGSEQPTALLCSPDGQRLFAGTDRGLRVYDWNALMQAEEVTPPSTISMDAGAPMHAHIRALVFDGPANRLLFAGLDGVIRCLDLSSAGWQPLIALPGSTAVLEMGLSADRRFLCCVTQEPATEHMRSSPPLTLQVWNYGLLSERLQRG